MIKPSVDYRQLRFSRLNTPEFSHVWLLLYWLLFGLGFWYVERFYPVSHYINMHCALDDLIPFNEWFLIPYLFWFVYPSSHWLPVRISTKPLFRILT